ncbi:major tail protein V [Escherichia coli]|nr:major tail protein V [Escherichia coli]
MSTPNPLEPVKGAGTTLWVYNVRVTPMQTRCQTMTGSDWLR